MNALKSLCLCLPLLMLTGHANAEAAALNKTYYGGMGNATTDDPSKSSDVPFSLGVMFQAPSQKLIVGFDLAGEGTTLDSTYQNDEAPVRSISLNLLAGANLIESGKLKVDAAALLGIFESSRYCAQQSYLGLQCYADEKPYTTYEANLGAVVTLSVDRFVFGVRATGESTQIVAGLRF